MLKQKYFVIVLALLVVMVVLFNILAGNLSVQEGQHLAAGKNTVTQETGPAISYLASPGEQETYAIIAGHDTDVYLNMTKKTLEYLHASYKVYTSYNQIPKSSVPNLSAIIVTTNYWDGLFTSRQLEEYLNAGGRVLIEQLPSEAYLESNHYFEVLGILDMGLKRPQKSVRFYDNLLVSDHIYEDIDLTAYQVSLAQSCKVYAHEFLMPEDGHWPDWAETLKYNPLIWRNYWNGGQVQIVNGNFMDDLYGMGILAGILAEMEKVSLVPVVNVNMLSFQDLPSMYRFDSEQFQKNYYRSSEQTLQELIWPTLIALSMKTELPITAFWTPGYDGMNREDMISPQDMELWLKEFTKYQFELGISSYGDDPNFSDPSREMIHDLHERFPSFTPASYLTARSSHDLAEQLADEPQLRVIVEHYHEDHPDDWALRFEDPEHIVLPVSSDGYRLNSRDRLVLDSLVSGFGYLHTQIDLSDFYGTDTWTQFSSEIGDQIAYTTSMYPWLNKVNVSEGGAILSRFLSSDPVTTRTDSGLHVECDKPGMQFIFRCEYYIADIQGGISQEIKEDLYLITMQEKEMNIELRGVSFK